MIEIDAKEIEKAKELLAGMPGAARKATESAIRRSMTGAKSDAAKEVNRRYHITQKEVRKTLHVQVAVGAAQLISRGRATDLVKFKTNPKSPEGQLSYRRRGKYLYASVVNGQGGTIAHAFVARMKNGHVGVFQRNGHGSDNRSNPLHGLYGPSIPQALSHKDVVQLVEKGIESRLSKNINHEVNAFLMGYRQ